MQIRLQHRRRSQGKRPPGKLNIALLSLPVHRLHFNNELAQCLASLPVAAAAVDENASTENRWYQLRYTVRSTALAVLGYARRQHEDWFDDNDAAFRNLFAEKNRLHKAYGTRPTDEIEAAIYRSHRLAHQQLREMQGAWRARKAEEIQGYADRNKRKNFLSAIKAVYCPPRKKLILLSAPTVALYSLRRQKFFKDEPSTSDASSTVPPPSLTSPSPVCIK
nr:unnamed protein product [Spirometra erinaceieuropaei]